MITSEEVLKLAAGEPGIREGFRRTLSRESMGETAAQALQSGLVAGAAGATAAGLGFGTKKLIGAVRRARGFKKMLAAHPSLGDEDHQQVRRAYNMVHHLSPHVAQDPLAAGSLVRSVVATGGEFSHTFVSPELMKNLADVQFRIGPKPSGIGQAFVQGVAAGAAQPTFSQRRQEMLMQERIRGAGSASLEKLKSDLRRRGMTPGELGRMAREERLRAQARAQGEARVRGPKRGAPRDPGDPNFGVRQRQHAQAHWRQP